MRAQDPTLRAPRAGEIGTDPEEDSEKSGLGGFRSGSRAASTCALYALMPTLLGLWILLKCPMTQTLP